MCEVPMFREGDVLHRNASRARRCHRAASGTAGRLAPPPPAEPDRLRRRALGGARRLGFFGAAPRPGNLLDVHVSITNGSAGVSFVGNDVSGSISITGNSGGFVFSGNSASGSVATTGNA